jgi:hypothetical protein
MVICDKCNGAEGHLKRELKLPRDFLFSIDELAGLLLRLRNMDL